jgi:predicted CoA-binding protein
MKPTLVIGASTDPTRYSYRAINLLRSYGHPVFGLGRDKGSVSDVQLVQDWVSDWKVDTVTLYINPRIQSQYYDRIIELKPNRVIFNPGTENPEFAEMLAKNGIESEEACTLVLLSIGEY